MVFIQIGMADLHVAEKFVEWATQGGGSVDVGMGNRVVGGGGGGGGGCGVCVCNLCILFLSRLKCHFLKAFLMSAEGNDVHGSSK